MSETYKQLQPELFNLSDTQEGVVELFPEVWNALALLISSTVEERILGLEQLNELRAHRLSPVVAYIIATCLDDEDIKFRVKVVQTVGGLLSHDEDGFVTPLEVKKQLRFYLSKMRQRRIFALLQVVEYQPSTQSEVALLLKACSHAGTVLGDIFSDRKLPIEIRHQAIYLSGLVGFLETIPRLERLEEKLLSRMNGQRTMPFVASVDQDENGLLPTIQTALARLNSP